MYKRDNKLGIDNWVDYDWFLLDDYHPEYAFVGQLITQMEGFQIHSVVSYASYAKPARCGRKRWGLQDLLAVNKFTESNFEFEFLPQKCIYM